MHKPTNMSATAAAARYRETQVPGAVHGAVLTPLRSLPLLRFLHTHTHLFRTTHSLGSRALGTEEVCPEEVCVCPEEVCPEEVCPRGCRSEVSAEYMIRSFVHTSRIVVVRLVICNSTRLVLPHHQMIGTHQVDWYHASFATSSSPYRLTTASCCHARQPCTA